MKKTLLLLTVTLLFLSCNKADFSQIKVGMPLKEVVELVGEPKEQQDNPLFGKWYIYDTHIVVFTSDTVVKCTSMEEFKGQMEEFNKGMDKLNESLKTE